MVKNSGSKKLLRETCSIDIGEELLLEKRNTRGEIMGFILSDQLGVIMNPSHTLVYTFYIAHSPMTQYSSLILYFLSHIKSYFFPTLNLGNPEK